MSKSNVKRQTDFRHSLDAYMPPRRNGKHCPRRGWDGHWFARLDDFGNPVGRRSARREISSSRRICIMADMSRNGEPKKRDASKTSRSPHGIVLQHRLQQVYLHLGEISCIARTRKCRDFCHPSWISCRGQTWSRDKGTITICASTHQPRKSAICTMRTYVLPDDCGQGRATTARPKTPGDRTAAYNYVLLAGILASNAYDG